LTLITFCRNNNDNNNNNVLNNLLCEYHFIILRLTVREIEVTRWWGRQRRTEELGGIGSKQSFGLPCEDSQD